MCSYISCVRSFRFQIVAVILEHQCPEHFVTMLQELVNVSRIFMENNVKGWRRFSNSLTEIPFANRVVHKLFTSFVGASCAQFGGKSLLIQGYSS